MIDNEKIIAARVAARMEEPTDLPDCNYEDFCKHYKGPKLLKLRRWREFEIEKASTIKKIDLAKHHTQKIHRYMKGKLDSEPLNGQKGFNHNARAICGEIEYYPNKILDRLSPVFVAFDSLDPAHQVRKKIDSITNKFESQASAIRTQFPSGKGKYQNREKALIPIGEKYLRDCFDITGKLIRETFQSKPW